MKAAIITIGEEILIGQVVDTNSAWIATQLNLIGVSVQRIISISDSEKDIIDSLNQLVKQFDIILLTGGLGPTSDDITKPALCKFFGSDMICHQPSVKLIEHLFTSRGLPVTELNLKQAEIPECCEPLLNKQGTAPGMWFKYKDCNIISLPGVPFEMKALMQECVLPRLNEVGEKRVIVHRTLHTFGLPESFLAEKLIDWEKNLPISIKVAYLPSPISIRIRITSTGYHKYQIEASIQEQVDKLMAIIAENIYGLNDNDTMASVVGVLLRKTKSTLSIAESCTGGNISHLITEISGSSDYFFGGVVAYSNLLKQKLLNVDEQLINEHGAVSQQVVEAMAQGARRLMGTTYAIATSGIAGPDGGSPHKPVGTLWVAISSPKRIVSKKFMLGNNRDRNIQRGSVAALNMLRQLLTNDSEIVP